MWKQTGPNSSGTIDEKKVRSISIWHFLLMTFIVLWMGGAYVYLDQKTKINIGVPPVIVLDAAGGLDVTNFFKATSMVGGSNTTMKSQFDIKEKYILGDMVVVKYFYTEAIVIDKSAVGDTYTILYKDHNHVLQKIVLPRTMLMAPAEGYLNPVSLLTN